MEHDQKGPIFAKLNSLASSQAAKALVEGVCAEAIEWERQHGRLKKRRPAKDTISFKKAVETLLADLLRANSLGREGTYHSLKREAFTGASVGYRSFIAAADALVGLGLAEHTPGKSPRFRVYFEGVVGNLGRGRASVYAATPELLERAEALGVSGDISKHFKPELPRHPLRLKHRATGQGANKKRGKPMLFERGDPIAQRLEKLVRDINEFLAGFTIEGANHYGFHRVFNCGDDDDFRWNKGGRLYSVGADESYQHMPASRTKDRIGRERAGRDEITINGEPVAEIDIRSCNLTIFYALVDEPLNLSEDPFSNLGIDRDLAKAWVNACFGAGKLVERWSPKFVSEYNEDHGYKPKATARAVGVKVVEKLPHLKRLNDPDAPQWYDLQYLESESIIGAMEALRQQGIPSLPVHDSLIIPRKHVEIARDCLTESFFKVVGVRPYVTIKGAGGP